MYNSFTHLVKPTLDMKISIMFLNVLNVCRLRRVPDLFCWMFSWRFWEKSPPFPSTRPRAARSTWARSPSTVTSSAPRAPRWTSSYHKKMMNLWVLDWAQSFLFQTLLPVKIISSVLQKEFPVPEQFKTVWDGSKLVTEPTEIAG